MLPSEEPGTMPFTTLLQTEIHNLSRNPTGMMAIMNNFLSADLVPTVLSLLTGAALEWPGELWSSGTLHCGSTEKFLTMFIGKFKYKALSHPKSGPSVCIQPISSSVQSEPELMIPRQPEPEPLKHGQQPLPMKPSQPELAKPDHQNLLSRSPPQTATLYPPVFTRYPPALTHSLKSSSRTTMFQRRPAHP
ncbi:hypothetical protein DPEC_G00002350 [Dallia pectoralis]|uniref:Uncharacterized protein n=1 Tax=Dallia pectoralis TaxID=75939 RepID=A0ACC2HJG7_DALPE|nr:hypothetical protein DPEC_G00002350 [Dallia pectoralis]